MAAMTYIFPCTRCIACWPESTFRREQFAYDVAMTPTLPRDFPTASNGIRIAKQTFCVPGREHRVLSISVVLTRHKYLPNIDPPSLPSILQLTAWHRRDRDTQIAFALTAAASALPIFVVGCVSRPRLAGRQLKSRASWSLSGLEYSHYDRESRDMLVQVTLIEADELLNDQRMYWSRILK